MNSQKAPTLSAPPRVDCPGDLFRRLHTPRWVGPKGAAGYGKPGDASTATNEESEEHSEPRDRSPPGFLAVLSGSTIDTPRRDRSQSNSQGLWARPAEWWIL